jgi:phage baseplate assembly protein W
MATIYLDNLIKPRQTNSNTTLVFEEPVKNQYTYTDLHLDFAFANNIGDGTNPSVSNDIAADYDISAIRNAIFNIFTIKPGYKILNPEFGASLEQYLFEPLSDYQASFIGKHMLRMLDKYEPRIKVEQIQILPKYEENLYMVTLIYKILDKGLIDNMQIQLQSSHKTVGATTISYSNISRYV